MDDNQLEILVTILVTSGNTITHIYKLPLSDNGNLDTNSAAAKQLKALIYNIMCQKESSVVFQNPSVIYRTSKIISLMYSAKMAGQDVPNEEMRRLGFLQD